MTQAGGKLIGIAQACRNECDKAAAEARQAERRRAAGICVAEARKGQTALRYHMREYFRILRSSPWEPADRIVFSMHEHGYKAYRQRRDEFLSAARKIMGKTR